MKCPIEGCNKEINGMTGYQELCNLQAHMNRSHRRKTKQKKKYDVFSAMVLRDHAEEGVKLKEGFE